MSTRARKKFNKVMRQAMKDRIVVDLAVEYQRRLRWIRIKFAVFYIGSYAAYFYTRENWEWIREIVGL